MNAASFKTRVSVVDELQNCSLIHLKQTNQMFNDLCMNPKVGLDDIKAFSKYMNQMM